MNSLCLSVLYFHNNGNIELIQECRELASLWSGCTVTPKYKISYNPQRMKRSRSLRSIAALIALFSMLLMQLAMASYVCPGMGEVTTVVSVVDNAQSMPDCHGMDVNQPALCHVHAHDQAGKQSLDKPELPAVSPFLPAGLVLTLDAVEEPVIERPAFHGSSLLNRATAPPIAIRNCCLRI
jgi:hypothetical protein